MNIHLTIETNMDARERAQARLIFNRVLNAMVGPFLPGGNGVVHTITDGEAGGATRSMTMDDLTAFIRFLDRTLNSPIENYGKDIEKVVQTFWYVCDSLLTRDFLLTKICREAILNCIGACNNLAVKGSPDFVPSSQVRLSGMFGFMYSNILTNMTKDGINIPEKETRRFEAYMWCLGMGMSNVGNDTATSLCDLSNHLEYWTLTVLDKVKVPTYPLPQIVKLMLSHGASLSCTDKHETLLDKFRYRFCTRLYDFPRISDEERGHAEECARLLHGCGVKSNLPFGKILEDIQTRDHTSSLSSIYFPDPPSPTSPLSEYSSGDTEFEEEEGEEDDSDNGEEYNEREGEDMEDNYSGNEGDEDSQ
jgi:hypothetical protein